MFLLGQKSEVVKDMLVGKSKIINFLLCVWQLPQIIVGLLMLIIFRNKVCYVNKRNGVFVWRISHGGLFGRACFSTGPFIITVDSPSDDLLLHETGHSLQSIYLGLLYHIVVSIPSICLFWYRRIKKKDLEWYHSCWPESWADKCGCVNDKH